MACTLHIFTDLILWNYLHVSAVLKLHIFAYEKCKKFYECYSFIRYKRQTHFRHYSWIYRKLGQNESVLHLSMIGWWLRFIFNSIFPLFSIFVYPPIISRSISIILKRKYHDEPLNETHVSLLLSLAMSLFVLYREN